MHRTTCVPQIAFWSVLLGLTLGGAVLAQQPTAPATQPRTPLPPPTPVQEKLPATTGGPVIVPHNGTLRLQMTAKKPIRKVVNEKETAVRVTEVPGDPTTIIITGLTPDTARLILTDVDGKEEIFSVVVQFDVEYLRTLLQRALPTATVTPIPAASNTVLLTGTVARAEDVDIIIKTAETVVGQGKTINAMKVGGVMQVQLDVVVAQVSRSESRKMSFEFLNDGSQHVLSNGFGALTVPSGGISGTFPGFPQIVNTVGGSNQGSPTNIFFAIFTPKQDFFGFLQLLRDEGLAKILTQPRVVTMSGRPASFVSGGEVPIPQAGGLGTTTITFKEIGTVVNFLPIVLGNGKIYLEVQPEVTIRNDANGINSGGVVVPGFDTQRVRATVEIEPGHTLAIGGLIEHRTVATSRKVPVLGDLPFIGVAFSQKSYVDSETELVVLVTPHLVDTMDCSQVPKILPGMETRKPDDFELFLEGILEAPRGSRKIFPDGSYVPAYKCGPTADKYPCAGNDKGQPIGCNNPGSVAPATPAGSVMLPAATTISPLTPPAPLFTGEMRPQALPEEKAPVQPESTPPVPEPSPAEVKPVALPDLTGTEGGNVPK